MHKRLLLIKEANNLRLEYVQCGKYGKPTKIGEAQIGKHDFWWALDVIPKSLLLEVCRKYLPQEERRGNDSHNQVSLL